jgi:Rod binding domain-containing protein
LPRCFGCFWFTESLRGQAYAVFMIDLFGTSVVSKAAGTGPDALREAQLRETARDLESAFLAEMLKQAGVAEAFGSAEMTGADAFSSFLLEAVAEKMSQSGGLGLAEKFYQQLSAADRPAGRGVKL